MSNFHMYKMINTVMYAWS